MGGLVCAGLAAVFAGVALWPSVSEAINIRALRAHYLTEDAVVTGLKLLDTRIALQEVDDLRLDRKLIWTQRAAVALALSIVLVLVGVMVDSVHARDGGLSAWTTT